MHANYSSDAHSSSPDYPVLASAVCARAALTGTVAETMARESSETFQEVQVSRGEQGEENTCGAE